MPLLIELVFITLVIFVVITISSNKKQRVINSTKAEIEHQIGTVEELKTVKKLQKTLEDKKRELTDDALLHKPIPKRRRTR